MAKLPPEQVAARVFHTARRPRRARQPLMVCASSLALSAVLLCAGAQPAGAQQAAGARQADGSAAQADAPATTPPPHAKTLPLSKSEAARVHFELAEQERHELELSPAGSRTPEAYQKVIDTYRTVYRGDPTNPKAPGAMAAVADLMAESGRRFADKKTSRSAADAYEYLRKQYPASPIRQRALLAEGDIYAHDLADTDTARQKYEEFLKQYPASDLLPQARQALAALDKNAGGTASRTPERAAAEGAANAKADKPASAAAKTTAAAAPAKVPDAVPAAAATKPAMQNPAAEPPPTKSPGSAQLLPASTADTAHHDRLEVTAIRHWITPDSTRVAIDLDGDVRYESGRAFNPDRIFFDLHGAHLSSQLPGHSVSVTGDALLKNIRFAQYTLDTVRVVLDINAAADYTAHLMKDPDRLIIEVHPRAMARPAEVATHAADSAPAGTAASAKPAETKADGAKTAAAKPAPAGKAPAGKDTATAAAPATTPGTDATSTGKPDSGSGAAVASAKAGKKTKPQKGAPEPATAAASTAPAQEEHETGISQPPPDVSVSPDDDTGNGGGGGSAQRIDLRGAHPQTTPVNHTSEATTPAVALQIATAEIARPPRPQESLPSFAFNTPVPLPTPSIPARTYPAAATPPPSRPGAPASTTAFASDADAIPLGADNSLTRPPASHGKPNTAGDLQVHAARPAADGERSLVRALGLKIGRIVIDPGHGGHDNGTVGPDGLAEKDLVLDVSLRLGKLLHDRLGADVVYTRSDDTFVPLEARTAIANNAGADLFISVHANSSPDHTARGVETYYLNFTAAPDSLEVAARENAASGESVHQLGDLVKEITLKNKLDESREFATDVEHALWSGMAVNNAAIKDRGVKKAPFVVLIGANMPSILTEISFVTNPRDARQLRLPAYRERIAASLYAGVARYVNSLSSVRLAQADVHKGN